MPHRQPVRVLLLFVMGTLFLLSSAQAYAAQTAYLRPDSDLLNGNWAVVGSASRWSALNDGITEQQTPTAADYIVNSNPGGGSKTEVGLETIQLGNAVVQEARLWLYMPNSNSLNAYVKDANETTLGTQRYTTSGWHSLSVSLSGSQTQLDGLRVAFSKGDGSASRIVYAAFLKLTLELPASERLLHIGISANSRSAKTPGDTQSAVAETGAHDLREDLDWKSIEPTDGEWTWGQTDQMFTEAAERGMRILPLLNSPPCWAVPPGTESAACERTYPEDDSDFADFTAHVVARYGIGGAFWQGHPSLDGNLAPRYFEIWNEPYFPYFTNGEVNPARYADLYVAAVTAGRLANSSSRYLIEATWKVDPGPVNWGGAMKAHNSALGSYVDGIAIHPYPGSRDPFAEPSLGTPVDFNTTGLIYEYWKNELGINKPIWITEVGYSSCADEATECVPGDTQAGREETKAAWLADLFDLIDRGNYGYIHAAYLYNFFQSSDPKAPNSTKSNWFGITDSSGLLPAWYSFKEAVAAYDGTPVPNTTITSVAFGINGKATFAFTVTDPTATLECQLDSKGWSPCSSPRSYDNVASGHTFQVRGTNDESTESTPASHTW